MLNRHPGSERNTGGYVVRPEWGPLSEPAIPSVHTTPSASCSILKQSFGVMGWFQYFSISPPSIPLKSLSEKPNAR